MSIINGANAVVGSAAGGYEIPNSLRFNSADSAYLNRTPASAGNRKTWTWSAWVKRSSFGVQILFMAGSAGTDYTGIYFNSDDTLVFENKVSNANAGRKITTAVYRDPSAWYHLIAVFDTDNATADDRIRLYINGQRITVFTTSENPTSGQVGQINNNVIHTISRNSTSAVQYINGYMAEVHFIDGSALTPSSFGETDTDTNVWQPIAYEGSYGTNGFYLPLNNTTSIYNLTGDQKSGTITRYTTPGTYTFTVPSYNSSVVVELWGGGGGSGGSGPTPGGANGGAGSASTFAAPGGTLSAGGGGGGATSTSGLGAMGAGGTASGGDVNTNGTTGTGVAGASTTGYAAPNGYWNSVATTQASNGPAFVGKFAGGAATGSNWYVGGGAPIGGSGGSGAYVKKTYNAGVLTSGSTITVVVGSGGTAGGQGGAWTGAAGADGEVRITVDGVTTPADWFPANISITAGAGNDSLVDSPTRYGTDTGAGGEVRGNYATLNPLATNANFEIANGNLDYSDSGAISACRPSRATIAISSGKWYWEVTTTTVGGGNYTTMLGIADVTNTEVTYTQNRVPGYAYATNGDKVTSSATASYGSAMSNGDVIGVAFDADAGTITFYKNNTSQGTAFTGITGTYYPMVAFNTGTTSYSMSGSVNFGQRPFAYTAPSGFKALCTTNLPEPTVADGSEYFNAVLWTGNATNRSITTGMAPDFVWIKHRSTAENHNLYDVLRGVGYRLESNSSDVQTYYSDRLTTFTSTGFNLGTGYNNTSGTTYVGWAWKGGGSGVTNNIGTVQSTVSANTTSGISIVKASLSSSFSGITLGHGLGVAPTFIIGKPLIAANWYVYHSALGNTKGLYLNDTSAAITQSGLWNNTSPTSTVFSVGTASWWTGSVAADYIFYAFAPIAGYSAFGSYIGNGSTDGPFVFTGFRPKFILGKRTDSTGNWLIIDTVRDTTNPDSARLFPNLSNAEDTSEDYDILSNGFKPRTAGALLNVSGATYIYAAFAENPFKYSLAR